MQKAIDDIISSESNYIQMSENAWQFLEREFKVDYSYQIIINRLKNV